MKNIVLIGAGGHAKSCIDIIEDASKFKIEYLLDKKLLNKKKEKKQKKPKKRQKNLKIKRN